MTGGQEICQRFLAIACRIAALALLVLAPTAVFGQTGTIAGSVRDSTGAVLPGVTVEASSPALIEKVRTATTDGEGQYKIVDLRPGTYAVTFTLPGFSTMKRDGIELSAAFTANVSVEMRVGAVSETLTVSGATPLVDVQNTRQQQVMTRTMIDSLPVGKTQQSMAVLIPGVVFGGAVGAPARQDVGGIAGETTTVTIHGSRGSDMPLVFDGLRYNNMNGRPGGALTIWSPSAVSVQEVSMEVGGQSAEIDVSGVRMNAIPREGGNTFTGYFLGNFANHNMQATNLTDAVKAFGITAVPAVDKLWDVGGAFGGPVRRDKAWFLASYRYWGNNNGLPGVYADKDLLDWVYTPDTSRPVFADNWFRATNLRLTYQANPKNKFAIFGDDQQRCSCHFSMSATTQAEAAKKLITEPNLMLHGLWNSTVTNRLLIDTGIAVHPESWSMWAGPTVKDSSIAGVIDLATGVAFRGAQFYSQQRHLQWNWRANVSYVTGSNALKVGLQSMHGWRRTAMWAYNNSSSYSFFNGVPRSVTYYAYPYDTKVQQKWHIGLFAQDQWTLKRMTLNGGVRFDAVDAFVPPQSYGAGPWVGERSFPGVYDVPNWKDISPRFGVAYDLFGNGRTALKANIGRYVEAASVFIADATNPVVTSVNVASRTWSDANGDYIPQDSELGPLSNSNFGKLNVVTRYDPGLLDGWGKRGFNWETQLGVQHEIRPGFSVSATYSRHWWGNFTATQNQVVGPGDFDRFCIAAPPDARLPGGGGYPVCGFDIKPAKFGQSLNLVNLASNFGKQTDVFNGVDLSVNLRLPRGILLQGGTGTGREVTDNCEVVAALGTGAYAQTATSTNQTVFPTVGPNLLGCRVSPPVLTQVKLLGIYPLPKQMSVSATFQSIPGPMLTANYIVPNALIAPVLGRNLSAGANGTASIEIIPPGTVYGERLNQVDTRFSKTVKTGRARFEAQFDLFNLFNRGPVTSTNPRYGPAWLTPTSILSGRILKVGLQANF
jgi:hypothetical protein